MMHFFKGWDRRDDGPMSFHEDTKQDIESAIVFGRIQELDGLPDRWKKKIEMENRKRTSLWYYDLLPGRDHEPEVHCVKEGL